MAECCLIITSTTDPKCVVTVTLTSPACREEDEPENKEQKETVVVKKGIRLVLFLEMFIFSVILFLCQRHQLTY